MILEKIVAYKRKKVEEEKRSLSMNEIISMIDKCSDTRDFKKALRKDKEISIIAEIKKASPSKGVIRKDFDPLSISRQYEMNKVEAISVLTEDQFFQGDNEYLRMVKSETSVPILRKDFIIDLYQIYQSRLLGADAILLIVGILTHAELITFQRIAKDVGLQCLIEVHDPFELERALDTEGDMIGINNRNLKTFETNIETTEKLIKIIPKSRTVVSESGIKTRKEMMFLKDVGVDGVLIGESLMKTRSITEKLRELRGELD